jgi:hypothetical protein
MHRSLSASLSFLVAVGFVACGGGGGSPTAPPPPAPPSNVARFVVVAGGQSTTVNLDNTRNLVFCSRNAGWASLFLRFAEQAAANGETSPHVDLDLCNHAGGGAFAPKDPTSTSCASGKTFDLYWHAADGSIFVNQPTAADCGLQITQNGTQLSGTFQCRDLVERNGTRRVDILEGSFECAET